MQTKSRVGPTRKLRFPHRLLLGISALAVVSLIVYLTLARLGVTIVIPPDGFPQLTIRHEANYVVSTDDWGIAVRPEPARPPKFEWVHSSSQAVSPKVGSLPPSGRTTYWSSDRQLRAVVISYPPVFYRIGESAVEVVDRKGHRLGYRDYRGSGTQGYHLEWIAWTPDARFLIYSLSSSGGHQPWYFPTHFFNRKSRRFGDLDSLCPGPGIGSARFQTGPGSHVTLYSPDWPKHTIDLSRLTQEQLEQAYTDDVNGQNALQKERSL